MPHVLIASFVSRFAPAAACLSLAVSASTHAQVARVGVLGDSLSDEYLEESYSYANNWTMQLVQFRGVDMGPTAPAAAAPDGTWGEPRRTGYEFNWSRYGADSSDMLAAGQHTGLAAQAASRGVTHAVMAIGANDFSPTTGAYFSIYWGLWSQSQIDSYISAQIADVQTAITTLDAAGLHILLCNYVDFGIAPVTRQFYGNATRRSRVAAVIAEVNRRLELTARRHRLVTLDLGSMATAIFGTHTALRQFLTIGNVQVQLFERDTAAHANPLAGFVDDGAHPHTTVQGVFANAILTALNTAWNAGLPPFTDHEILAHAGIAYGGSDTLSVQIGPYDRFVRDFRCPGNFNGDAATTVQDLFDFLAAYFAAEPAADINASGALTVQDIFDFLSAYFAGC